MAATRQLDIRLKGDNNGTIIGTLTIEEETIYQDNNLTEEQNNLVDLESDPAGASSYILAVILIYGLSIVFLIGSHVIIKKREQLHMENEKQINKFLLMKPTLKEKSAKDSYKSLKQSIIPVVASSPARDLVTRRKSFLHLIHGVGPPSVASSSQDGWDSELGESEVDLLMSSDDFSPPSSPLQCVRTGHRMSIINEEGEVVEVDPADANRRLSSTGGMAQNHTEPNTQNSNFLTVPEIAPRPENQLFPARNGHLLAVPEPQWRWSDASGSGSPRTQASGSQASGSPQPYHPYRLLQNCDCSSLSTYSIDSETPAIMVDNGQEPKESQTDSDNDHLDYITCV